MSGSHSRRNAQSEDLAHASVTENDFSLAAVQRALENADIPWNTTRKNVFPDGETGVRGMLLGFFFFGGSAGCSTCTTEHAWLTKLLAGHVKRARPDFLFTSIQVNKNYASRPHVDKNNLGQSLILGLGDYTDGQLWVHDDKGDVPLELKEDIFSAYRYRSGKSYSGTVLDCRNEIIEFDGTKLHYTLPFTGDRYTLVFFTSDMFMRASEETRAALNEAGFNFSWSCQNLLKSLHEQVEEKKRHKDELRAQFITEWREQQRKEREKLGRCFARTWNKGWGGACPHWRAPENEVFCRMHEDERETWKTHGRIDGVIPAAKQAEMLKWQKILVGKGELPPSPLPYGSCVMVPLPNWSFETIIPGLQGYLPPTVVDARGEEKHDAVEEDLGSSERFDGDLANAEQPRKRKRAGEQQLMTAFFSQQKQKLSGEPAVATSGPASKHQLMSAFFTQPRKLSTAD
jgi:hypothetical protein